MGDRSNAQIRIGGQVSRTKKSEHDPDETVLNVLVGMINDAAVSHEFGDVNAQIPLGDEAVLLEYLDEDGTCLQFRDDLASEGRFEELEELCRKEGIPYQRWSCVYGGWEGEEVTWLPDMENPITIPCNDHGDDLCKLSVVREVMQLLINFKTEAPPRSEYLDEALSKLREVCPDIPKLPKFEIAD